MDAVRIDRWLSAARIYASRSQATDACVAGQVTMNGAAVRASHMVRVGDELSAHAPRGIVIVKIMKLADKRLGPPLARELYEDHSPPPPPREELFPMRDRGAGRPTKQERRRMDRMRVR
ncbi:MAG TPA: RNA-binding S4 domain-containing protein [Polyangiaceae bacterium]|nr:RNA-binding S4 domain-containing protein [Polyangiaceae bacterium]